MFFSLLKGAYISAIAFYQFTELSILYIKPTTGPLTPLCFDYIRTQ